MALMSRGAWRPVARWQWRALAAAVGLACGAAWLAMSPSLNTAPATSEKPSWGPMAATEPRDSASDRLAQGAAAQPAPGLNEPAPALRLTAEKLIAGLAQEEAVDPSQATSNRVDLDRNNRVSRGSDALASTEIPAAAQDAGLPVFPGAIAIPEQTIRHGANGESITAVLTTPAPLADVVAFYRQAQTPNSQGERVRTERPTAENGLDLREVNTRERAIYRIQVAPVEATVYIRLSRHRLP
jgi:hypothetical protein